MSGFSVCISMLFIATRIVNHVVYKAVLCVILDAPRAVNSVTESRLIMISLDQLWIVPRLKVLDSRVRP